MSTSFDISLTSFNGQFTDAAGAKPYRLFSALDSRCDFVCTGTALTLSCFVGGGSGNWEVTVDGSLITEPTPVDGFNTWTTAPVFTGLSDTAHTVSIRSKGTPGLFYLDRTSNAGLIVTGGSPAIAVDPTQSGITQYVLTSTATDGIGRAGILNHIRLESGAVSRLVANPSCQAIQGDSLSLGSDGTYASVLQPSQIRFDAAITDVGIWTYLDGSSKFALIVDGKLHPSVTVPNTARWGLVWVASGLDAGSNHTYGLVVAYMHTVDYNFGAGAVFSLHTKGGTGVRTSTQPAARPNLILFGDSITANQTSLDAASTQNDGMLKWALPLSERLGMQFVNLGIGSTTARDCTANLGSFSGPSTDYVTKWSGEARAAHDLALTSFPTGSKVLIGYGTNDYGQAFHDNGRTLETESEFRSSCDALLTAALGVIPSTIPVYWWGITPRDPATFVGFSPQPRSEWNQQISDAITANGASNLHYLSVEGWNLAGASGTDFSQDFMDGLHWNPRGCAIAVTHLLNTLLGSPTFTAYPASVVASSSGTLDLFGGGTSWTSGTAYTASGGSLGSPSNVSGVEASIGYTAPGSSGPVTLTDTGTSAVFSEFVSPAPTTTTTTAAPTTTTTSGGATTTTTTAAPTTTTTPNPAGDPWAIQLTPVGTYATGTAGDVLLKASSFPQFGVNVLNYGVVGDGVIDDGPALNAVLVANPSRRILLPRTATTLGGVSYYSSQPLTIASPSQTLHGETAGFQDGTVIKFAPGVTGIEILHTATRAQVLDIVLLGQETYQQVYAYEGILPSGFTSPRAPITNIVRTSGVCLLTFASTYGVAGVVGKAITIRQTSTSGFNGTFVATAVTATTVTYNQAGSDDSSVSGFVGMANWDLADAVTPTSDGIRVGGQVSLLRNVICRSFGRHGFNLSNADVDSGQGLNDNTTLDSCYAYNCRGYGLYIAGGDSNASHTIQFNSSVNALGGWFDNSFLGNTHLAPKTDENHVDNATIGGSIPATQALASIHRTSNLVTLTFSSAYTGTDAAGSGLVPGHGITVSGMASDTSFNGTFVVVSVSGAVVTYAQAGANASPSVGSAVARRATMRESWRAAGIPPTSGAYRTSLSTAHRACYINPYSEGGQSEDGTGPSTIMGGGVTVLGGIGMSYDFTAGTPAVLALLTGIGQQGYDGFIPSIRSAKDIDVLYSEWIGGTQDQVTIRYRKHFDGATTLWTEMEGPAYKRLYKSDPASDGSAVLVWDIDRSSCNITYAKAVATGSGITGSRPSVTSVGSLWYDTTLHKPIWWDGTNWRDAAGTIV